MNVSGKILYKTTTSSNGKHVFEKTFASGSYFVNVGAFKKAIKIIKAN